jgi:hypothetical protein
MDEEYQKKLAIAKSSYSLIKEAMEVVKLSSPYEVDFCWDECITVGDENFSCWSFKDEEIQTEGVEPSRP